MAKQLVDLSDDERDKVDRISRVWKMNYTDTIKRMIREFPEPLYDPFSADVGDDLW
jgi:hypothetical protein